MWTFSAEAQLEGNLFLSTSFIASGTPSVTPRKCAPDILHEIAISVWRRDHDLWLVYVILRVSGVWYLEPQQINFVSLQHREVTQELFAAMRTLGSLGNQPGFQYFIPAP